MKGTLSKTILAGALAATCFMPEPASADIVFNNGMGNFGINYFLTGSPSTGQQLAADLFSTVTYCVGGGTAVEVSGAMANPRGGRDPIAGYKSDADPDHATVPFTLGLVPGGAKRPENIIRTEGFHSFQCGPMSDVKRFIYTWPAETQALVMDDTSSMTEELEGIKIAVQQALVEPSEINVGREFAYSLTTFTDTVTSRVPITTDLSEVVSAVDALYPSGGGTDCPEASNEALMAALNQLESDTERAGSIIFVTDASPKTDNRAQIVAKAESLNVPINVLLTGDCAVAIATNKSATAEDANAPFAAAISAQEYFGDIASATGGSYHYVPNGNVDDYAEVLGSIVTQDRVGYDVLQEGFSLIEGGKGSMSFYRIDVPAGTPTLQVRTTSGSGRVAMYLSKDAVPTTDGAQWVPPNNDGFGTKTISVSNPSPGTYYLNIVGITNYSGKRLRVSFGFL